MPWKYLICTKSRPFRLQPSLGRVRIQGRIMLQDYNITEQIHPTQGNEYNSLRPKELNAKTVKVPTDLARDAETTNPILGRDQNLRPHAKTEKEKLRSHGAQQFFTIQEDKSTYTRDSPRAVLGGPTSAGGGAGGVTSSGLECRAR
jgi:hypothetical protein